MEKLGDHAEKDALVFNGIGFFDVGVALFFHRHGFLADRYVNVGQKPRTREEVIELLKERLRPLPPRPPRASPTTSTRVAS